VLWVRRCILSIESRCVSLVYTSRVVGARWKQLEWNALQQRVQNSMMSRNRNFLHGHDFLARSRLFSSVLIASPNANLFDQHCFFPALLLQRLDYYSYITDNFTKLYKKRTTIMADPKVPPDLASILATLAQFAPQQQQDQQPPPPTSTTPTITDPRLQRRQQNQPSPQPYNQIPQHLQQNTPQSSTPYNPQATVFQPIVPQQRPIPQPSRTSTPQQQEHTIIDPATITEWSAGLRCVTKIAAQNPLFAEKIRGVRIICIINFLVYETNQSVKLINDQRRNEMQWYVLLISECGNGRN
jgi:hypothetical protein